MLRFLLKIGFFLMYRTIYISQEKLYGVRLKIKFSKTNLEFIKDLKLNWKNFCFVIYMISIHTRVCKIVLRTTFNFILLATVRSSILPAKYILPKTYLVIQPNYHSVHVAYQRPLGFDAFKNNLFIQYSETFLIAKFFLEKEGNVK